MQIPYSRRRHDDQDTVVAAVRVAWLRGTRSVRGAGVWPVTETGISLKASSLYLLEQLNRFRLHAHVETDPTVRTTFQLLSEEIIAELGRRNDAAIANRDATVEKLVAAATAIVEARR